MHQLIDESPLGHASLELLVNLLHQMYEYGELYELTDKDYSAHLKINIPDNENDRKRLMGHSFGKDITNSVYGHRELDDLRKEIEKIIVKS